MALTNTEILGLYVLYAINFLPVCRVFFSASSRYASYMYKRPTVLPREQAHLSPPVLGFLDFTIQDPLKYAAYRQKNRAVIPVLPYYLYLLLFIVTAGVETAGMFLVWYDQAAYSTGIYQASMALQFVILFFKVVWTFTFFDVPQYNYAAWTGAMLAALTFTNAVIIVQDNTGAVANWFTYGWVAMFYIYSFLLALVFCHTDIRGQYHLVHGSFSMYSCAEALFGRPSENRRAADARANGFDHAQSGRKHGWTVDPDNRRESTSSGSE